ncbi:prolyl oligopeptidase family serine peptidase [Caulobacter vibrioides]|nr:prolyl oligopeptidase family protein [Caulobacter vibrioides]YP_002519175.1 serine protease, peptidase family S9A [Caulobacter vibrioides NA1000]ACL97267.1 serine protease, peptidase family S9A [Caulobacter vibrioides NA1000]ATC30489.1 S9 family peptidase [Caulobacter vibrioides]QXZ52024.1 prolyl oligopeptidase family protein [Caulobacter vibrioides]
MRKSLLALLASTSLMTLTPAIAADTAKPAGKPAAEARTPLSELGKDDPYLWMEEIEGTRAMDWAKAQNARSLPVLQGDARYADLESKALAILNAKDRVPGVSFAGDGSLRNFWQDKDHVRGIWRKTTLDSYRTAEPAWETILDIDALTKAENANWVFKGASCLPPEDTRCLITLSNGGKDAVTVREFDTTTKTFVPGGFELPEGKQNYTWLDKDTLLVGREWKPGELTKSGYAYVLKALKRGQPLDQAKEVFRGVETDVSVSPFVLRDADGKAVAVMATRGVTFFESETYLIEGDKPVKLDLPLKSSIQGYVDGQMVVLMEQDWPAKGFKVGDLISFDLAKLKAAPDKAVATLVLRPTALQSVEQVQTTRTKLVVGMLDNVKGAAKVFTHGPKGWTAQTLDLPANSAIGLGSSDDKGERLFVTVTGYLTPTTFWLADAGSLKLEQIKASPARFDASTHVVEQFEATSTDGTKVPYFVVRPKDVKYDGSAPTLLYAYGGFQVPLTPGYSGTMGKLWLERGGVYVVANIRGGGEFGPAWHSAGLKENRQKVYDDFFAVSQDLITRKITSPRRLGIMGGSNGGLLMGVALTQRPELYNAIVVQVPLFDMIRYSQIGAGASWVGEYGDPAIPSELAVIAKYDPYSNLKAGQKYPEVFIETSTKDDRVHPAHARKAAARLMELGYPVLYYENVDGGHAASANLAETARRQALEYVYLTRKLMD